MSHFFPDSRPSICAHGYIECGLQASFHLVWTAQVMPPQGVYESWAQTSSLAAMDHWFQLVPCSIELQITPWEVCSGEQFCSLKQTLNEHSHPFRNVMFTPEPQTSPTYWPGQVAQLPQASLVLSLPVWPIGALPAFCIPGQRSARITKVTKVTKGGFALFGTGHWPDKGYLLRACQTLILKKTTCKNDVSVSSQRCLFRLREKQSLRL